MCGKQYCYLVNKLSMPNLKMFQPSLKSDVEKLSLLVFREELEDAEALAYSIHKRLSKRNQ